MLSKIFGPPDLSLTEQEVAAREKLKRQIIAAAGGALLLVAIALVFARPVAHAIHGWQARRHAAKAFAFIDQEQWGPARDEALAAYRLRSKEPEAIRAVARLFSRAGHPQGLKFWHELKAVTKMTPDDLRDEAGLAIKLREFAIADASVRPLLEAKQPAPGDLLLAAQLELARQDVDRATLYVRQIFGSRDASERDQFQATLLLDQILDLKQAADRSEVNQHMVKFARGSGDVALDAGAYLGQKIAGGKLDANEAGISIDEIVTGLETHPLAKPQHKLLALDLKLKEHPSERDTLIGNAIDQFKNGDTATLVVLAAWLNKLGEFQREIDTIPRSRAIQTKELFFQHVDALGALGRWDEIRRLIEHEEFPLDPVVEHMYLARCFAQIGQMNGAANNWQRAMAAAAGDAAKLVTLAEYAEKNDAMDIAQSAFDAAAAVAPDSRHIQQGRLRIAYALHDTKKIHAILSELVKVWPNDTAVQNDEAYSRLLLIWNDRGPSVNDDVEGIAVLAEALVKREPVSLPHRSLLALARLRQNRPQDALAVYRDIQIAPGALTASALAIHSATLRAAGYSKEADSEISQLPKEQLLPEERSLVEKR